MERVGECKNKENKNAAGQAEIGFLSRAGRNG